MFQMKYYDGKDEFTFKVHDGTEFSNDAKVSIKIEENEKLSNDQVRQNDRQPNGNNPAKPHPMRKRTLMRRVIVTILLQAIQESSQILRLKMPSQQESDVKDEQKESSESDKPTESDADDSQVKIVNLIFDNRQNI